MSSIVEKVADSVKQGIRALVKKKNRSEENSSPKEVRKSAGTNYAKDVGVRKSPQAC